MMDSKARAFGPRCNRSLETLVPVGHFYRHLEAKLDLSFVRELVADRYAPVGRSSTDPVVLFKLQVVMFFEGIRSERELVRVAAARLSERWCLGYDLDEELPGHSSLTKIRQRYGVAVFRRFSEAIVEPCREAGPVWGEELYFGATQVDANASLESIRPRFAVGAHLGQLFAGPCAASGTYAEPGEVPQELPPALAEAVRAELAEVNAARHDWLACGAVIDVRGGVLTPP